jgi:uncharacterized protein YndB with AHSA1/START domain
VLVDAAGPASPDEAWRLFTTPDTWPTWARHLREVETDADVLVAGSTGRVLGPRGVAVDFTVTDVDPDLRSWSWTVGRGPLSVRMDHHVLATPAGGSRAVLRVHPPAAAAIQPYRVLAAGALRRLVSSPAAVGRHADEPVEPVASFDFAFTPSYAAAGRPFGVTPDSTGVEVGPRWLFVRYGPWRLVTPRANVASVEVTGGFSFVKTAGPPHLSFADRDVSFTPNGDRALCVRFHEPVPAIDPAGLLAHPGATLGVADPDGLADALTGDVRT